MNLKVKEKLAIPLGLALELYAFAAKENSRHREGANGFMTFKATF